MPFSERIWNHFFPEICWFQPKGKNLHRMLNIVDRVRKEDKSYLEFMLHSSELMPGGSPIFTNNKQIDKLYYDIEYIFDYVHNDFVGKTLNEYYVEK